ncbi:MAG: type 1 glutamine amidotransferase [Aliishimia sp.]
MRLAVLDLSYWPPEYMSGQPRFGDVLAAWVARGLPDAELSVIDIDQGAPIPDPSEYDGFVVSGSDKGVYDDASWMQGLRAFLLSAKSAQKPLFGVCFGHQVMADVFGGKAGKVSAPEVGVRHFQIDGQTLPAHVWHQDQVTQVPPESHVIAKADYCPVAGLAYDFPAMSVQFHPEYPADYVASFLRRSRGTILSEPFTDAALAELDESSVSADLFAAQIRDFFRNALSQGD